MKRFSLAFVLMLLFALAACGDQTTPDDNGDDNGNGGNDDDQDIVETCEENQIEVDGECITLNAIEMRRYDTFNNMQEVNNYRLITTIELGDETESFTLLWDDQITKISDDNEDVYYVRDGDICEEITVQGTVKNTVNVDCQDQSQNQIFYTAFEYDWFKTEDGTGLLIDEHLSFVEEALNFDDMWVLERLSLDVSQLMINQMVLLFVADEETMTITFEFEDYGDVSITLPETAVSE